MRCGFSTFFRIWNVDKLKTSFFSISTFFYNLKHFCAFCSFPFRFLSNPAIESFGNYLETACKHINVLNNKKGLYTSYPLCIILCVRPQLPEPTDILNYSPHCNDSGRICIADSYTLFLIHCINDLPVSHIETNMSFVKDQVPRLCIIITYCISC